jgi:uncharacterized SAM-binding protein YcdF (DUF218 family)
VGALAVAAAVALHVPLLRLVGGWLVVDDPLSPADAIVVLAGGTPGREIEAAALYRRGLAPRVVLSRPVTPPNHLALMKLGIRAHDWPTEARLVLQGEGVPATAIVALQTVVKRTEAELAVVHETARASGYRRLILVSSSDHGRRLSMIWARQPRPRVEALVHSVHDASFAPDRWWRERRMFELVLHEYLGILALSLGISHLMN